MKQKKFDKIIDKFSLNIHSKLHNFINDNLEDLSNRIDKFSGNKDLKEFYNFLGDVLVSIFYKFNEYYLNIFLYTIKLYNKKR